MRVLLTNDDGIEAPGLWALYEEFSKFADVTVVAPSAERSAVGHAITVFNEISLREHSREHGRQAYAVDGTPADCVKMALSVILKDSPPDIVISGINRGQNTGTSIIYSGTVAAAIEATMNGFKAIAVSLAIRAANSPENSQQVGTLKDVARVPADYSFAAKFTARLARIVVSRGLPPGVLLNVNIPALPEDKIKGVVVARMGQSVFVDEFKAVGERAGVIAYRNVGDRLIHSQEGEDWDDLVLREKKIAITPLHYDLTHHHFLEELKRWVESEDLVARQIGEEVAKELSQELDAEIHS
ncbi:MAG: 5'/3'-nucleotidase SurE [Candidatus Sumerlaeaceae bacterium]